MVEGLFPAAEREGLHGRRDCIVGLSEETTCYVALTYFTAEDRFADFVVHEAAHIFRNWKREYAGLRYTGNREWLLEIWIGKRETFAWTCEVFSRILALGANRRERTQLVDEYAAGKGPAEDRVDFAEMVDILREAVTARNGWKRILRRCAPPPQPRRAGARSADPVSH